MTDPRLARLAELAALRSARSAARLAPAQARAAALRAQAGALRDAPVHAAPDLAQAIVRDRHDIWRREQLRRLNLEIAMAEAEAQPLREARARDLAREAVIGRLRTGR